MLLIQACYGEAKNILIHKWRPIFEYLPPSDHIDSSIFYTINAKDFYKRTVNIDVEQLYGLFLPYLPKGSHILDAGCGSGRDTKAFLERGY